ncbi:hypothetical protein BLS_009667 [Venturia inaequalis]|uniref:Uncharacterized protein n=1 Tax=Venturia inaequalis TaxID=5025 RepID=A0A8H3YZH8_VENIN|nr:hypothetical protein BLS_009667 [Venturia inaequalis]RDI81959.1 General amino acid permease [Venturia inaequalis]
MSPASQQTNSVVFDTSIPLAPTGAGASQDLTGLPASATATSTSSPSSKSNGKTASPLDPQARGSGKNVGIAIGIAVAVLVLVLVSTALLFWLRKRKQAQHSDARLIRRTQLEDAPPPYLSSKGRAYHNSMQKGDLPEPPARPQGMVVTERPVTRSRPPIRSMNSEPPLPLPNQAAPSLRYDTQPSMPMTHLTEGSWATLPTMSTQPTLPKAYLPGRLAPLPNENISSRFST